MSAAMEVRVVWLTIWCTIFLCFLLPSAVVSDPIKADITHCQNSTYRTSRNGPVQVFECCPPLPTRPIIDGPPPLTTNYLRVRAASQCRDAAYAAKLKQAYALMRALPDDDPRSFLQQWRLHCSYCGAAFLTVNSSGLPQGIDVHWSWLFFPWHRWYVYFHERILQSLLGDPGFTLSYWNWETPYTVGDGSSNDGACLLKGDDFPPYYDDISSALYDNNRSLSAKGEGRLSFPDLSVIPTLPAAQQALYNASAQDVIDSNLNIMYQTMVSGGTTSETFMGIPYRAGEPAGNGGPNGGAGLFEANPHGSVHTWVGQDPPNSYDMGQLSRAARDPIFFAHHCNVDRLWQVWKEIGPIVGQTHEDFTDPDFLNAEFLFYDENKDLRRVTVAQSLDTKMLGYVYQPANEAAWLFYNSTKCSNSSNYELFSEAESLPSPTRDPSGYFTVEPSTKTFIMMVDRPENPTGREEFLTIDGIKLDRSLSTGFDVFVNWLDPTKYAARCKCAEYSGRVLNMAQSLQANEGQYDLAWRRSITKTLADVKAPAAPSKIVIALVPLFQSEDSGATLKFKSITITS